MATCDNQVGVKNILISFLNCDTGQTITSVSHKLANGDELPTAKICNYTLTPRTAGRVTRSEDNSSLTMNVIRDNRVPLSWYQGCAKIDVQIEWFDGIVWTATNGSVVDAAESDGHDVTVTAIFDSIDELLLQRFTAGEVTTTNV